ncbi:MAG: hydantoinase/oxoprolinase family protein [Candidatus Caldarchaeum sp.]
MEVLVVRLKVAVDVGGTFTDLVAVNLETGELFKVKVHSTPRAPEKGFLEAVKTLLKQVDDPSVELVVHVNTVGTNLFRGQLGLRLPKTALVTTKGFRDVLEIGRQNRPELYNIFYRRPDPVVPRERRFEVLERVDSDGVVLTPVDENELAKVADVMREIGVESLAVCFLNSYVNPVNEQKAKQFLTKILPAPVFASHEVDPEHREYERFSTTVVNAALAPVVARYLSAVTEGLREIGVYSPVHIMSSSGGLVDVEEAVSRPVACIESGPAAGVIGAARMAEMTGFRKVISFDMGGTTAKAGVVVDGLPATVPEIEVGGRVHMGRVVKGSGYPVRFPSIDLAEVSAGGGTIITVDSSGSLMVGPLSAGADPGPACYGLGGTMPTVTDANLLLGRVEHLLGGAMKLDQTLAEKAMKKVAEQLRVSVLDCAWYSLVLVNLQMARAIHIVTLERGLDPSEFVLFAFGGAGPMHAAELAEEIGVSTVVVPPSPGLFSSLGLLMTDMRYSYVKGFVKLLEPGDEHLIEEKFRELETTAYNSLRNKIDIKQFRVIRRIDMRYYGQGYEIEVEVSKPFSLRKAVEKFEMLHSSIYGYGHAGEKIEATAVRVALIIPSGHTKLKSAVSRRSVEKRVRKVFFRDGFHETVVLRRELLGSGFEAEGPLIVEEYDSTTVVPPEWRLSVDETGCMVLRK